MAENKNKILVYRDWISIFDKLKDVEAGKLIKHFFRYINDLDPKSPDRLTELMFEPLKQTLKRDLKKWELKSIKNSEIAKERWGKDMRTHTNASKRINKNAKDADTDTVNDSDTVNVKVKKKEYIPSVFLTESEFEKIKIEFKEQSDEALQILSNYKLSSGKKYKSDYHALLGWVRDKLKKEKNSGQKETKRNTVEVALKTHASVQNMIDNDPNYNE